MKFLFSFSLLWLASLAAVAQRPVESKATQYAPAIDRADLEKHLRILASDSLQGRYTGAEGQKMAAYYIARTFFEVGLDPVVRGENNLLGYYQPFELTESSWGEVFIKTESYQHEHLKNFYIVGRVSLPQVTTLPVAFAGYGIETEGYSDYKSVDVKDKAVVILSGEPQDRRGNKLVTGTDKASEWPTNWRKKAALAYQKGARLVLVVAETQTGFENTLNQYRDYLSQSSLGFRSEAANSGAVFISPDMAYDLLNTSERGLAKARKRLGRRKTARIKPGTFTIKAERTEKPVPTENVLGMVEGSDKKDEFVIITAHYDHVGTHDGQVFNGADDDGSGTVAVMEMAQAFAQAKSDGNGPRRSVIFMTVAGEEVGLLGSQYYTEKPVFPLAQTVANLNIDMIGRLDEKHANNPDYVYLIGSDKLSSELHKISEAANARHTQLALDYTYNDENDPNRFYYRSDHYNFAKNGIPVIFYFNGTHADYHQATDDVEKINFPKIEKIARLVFYTAWDLANRDERIKVDSSKK